MLIKCGACGESIEVSDGIVDGQHVRCPYCGEKTAYRKPTRIELPGATMSDHEGKKPKLGIHRPPQDNTYDMAMENKLREAINVQPPAMPRNTPSGTVSAVEERVRMYENMRQKNARTRMLRNFLESAILLMLLATIVALYSWWQDHKSKLEAEAAKIREDRIRLEAELDRQRQEQREKDRLAREAALAREREHKQKEREAREREERELRDNKERYTMYMMALKENKFDLFTRSVTNDMETAGGELCYLFPNDTMPVALFHVLFETNGTRRISRMEENGRTEIVNPEVLGEKINKLEYLVAKGDTVYFKSSRKAPATGLLNMAKESDPAETFFGTLAPVVKEIKPTYDELTFDIFFTPKESSKKIFVENLPFGSLWTLQSVRDAVEKSTTIKSSYRTKNKTQKFKRTAKIYNGTAIKRGIDGITYVPMTPPPERIRTTYSSTVPNCIYRTHTRTTYSDNSRARWQALFNKAQQEDQAEAAYYKQLQQQQSECRTAAQAADEQRWREKVDTILSNGTLSYRIRKAKMKE